MKTTKINFIGIGIITAVMMIIFSSSCKKNSVPPLKDVATGPSISIQQLRTMYAGINSKFTSNTLLNVVVTADETSGNLYKQVYVRDNSGTFAQTNYYGAISLHFTKGTQGILSIGDSIAVNLNGATLAKSSGGALELDSIDPYNDITHIKTGLNPQPIIVSAMQSLNTYSNVTGGGFVYDAQLVQLSNVEFAPSNVGQTYAIPQGIGTPPQNVNRYICDAYYGHTMVAYNSGYASFAGTPIPNNSGTIIAVANLYTTMQLSLRNFADVQLTNSYIPVVYDTITQNFSCAGLTNKNPVEAAGWKNVAYKGSLSWQGGQFGNPSNTYNAPNWKYYPSASNYKTNDIVNDMWLISPPLLDQPGGLGKYLDFSCAMQYGTNKRLLSVLVSGSYDGTNLDPSQWTDISSTFPGIPSSAGQSSNGANPNFKYAHSLSNNIYSPSPVHFVPPANNGKFYIAFRYKTSTNDVDSTGSTYLIGNFVLRNN